MNQLDQILRITALERATQFAAPWRSHAYVLTVAQAFYAFLAGKD